MDGVVLDAGALIGLERNTRRMQTLLDGIERRAEITVVPTPVLAQFWRGGRGPQTRAARLIGASVNEPLTEAQAKAAGELLGRANTSDVVDAVVALAAATHGSVITSDPDDIQHLLTTLSSKANIIRV